MKKFLFATMVDNTYIEQAKQLFSSAHNQGRWQGDYILLSVGIEESDLEWFRTRGILVKKVDLPFENENWFERLPEECKLSPMMTVKFYLLTQEFKKWDKIVYMDSDVIIRGSIKEMATVRKFGAIKDIYAKNIRGQLPKSYDPELLKELKKYISLNHHSFNAGIFCFDTKIIKDNTFENLKTLFVKFGKLSLFGDQLIFNIYFSKLWQKFSIIYNLIHIHLNSHFDLKTNDFLGHVLHFAGPYKPWDTCSAFYKEWQANYKNAYLTDFKKPIKDQTNFFSVRARKFVFFLKGFLICDVVFYLYGNRSHKKIVLAPLYSKINSFVEKVLAFVWSLAKLLTKKIDNNINKISNRVINKFLYKIKNIIWKSTHGVVSIINFFRNSFNTFYFSFEKNIIYGEFLYKINKKIFRLINTIELNFFTIFKSLLKEKKNIRVAFITWKYPNWHNTFTFYQISELINLGFDVTVFSIERSEEKAPRSLNCKVSCFQDYISPFSKIACFINNSEMNDLMNRFSSSFGKLTQAFPSLTEEMRKYDIIHAGFGNNPATAAMILSHMSGVPYTFESHAYDLYTDFNYSEEKIKTTKKIFTISNYNKKYLVNDLKCPEKKVSVKRVTFNRSFLKHTPPNLENNNLIVSVCRLHPIKALPQCLEAFKLSYEKNKNLRYIIIGDGELKGFLEDKIRSLGLEKVVTITGKLTQDKVLNILNEATLLLGLSTINVDRDRDGIPTSLIEAMSMGLPVISTRISGIPELIDDGLNGFLTYPDDILDTSKKIDLLTSNKKLRKRLGVESRKKILERFDISKNISLMTTTWKELVLTH